MSNKIYLILYGGLGNQFFQLSNAMELAQDREIIILKKLGNPRLTIDGMLEIEKYELPKNIQIDYQTESKLITKIVSYLLSKKLQEQNDIFQIYFMAIMENILEIILRLKLRTSIKTHVANQIGFHTVDKNSNFPIGYFQSYRFIGNQTKKSLRNITLKCTNENLQELIRQVQNEKPILVHIRLGDYKKEKNFGILSSEYLSNSIHYISTKTQIKKIWLFSDEPNLAKSIMPMHLHNQVKVVESDNFSSAEVLELMRHFDKYIISNSTFSWWGAFLSYEAAPVVVAPNPWFINIHNVKDIVPLSWNRVSRE